jgi:hypothetical protein
MEAFMRWYIECENGSRSRAHDTLEQASAALRALTSVQARMDPHYSEPVGFVSSEGEVRPLDGDAGEPIAAPEASFPDHL